MKRDYFSVLGNQCVCVTVVYVTGSACVPYPLRAVYVKYDFSPPDIKAMADAPWVNQPENVCAQRQ